MPALLERAENGLAEDGSTLKRELPGARMTPDNALEIIEHPFLAKSPQDLATANTVLREANTVTMDLQKEALFKAAKIIAQKGYMEGRAPEEIANSLNTTIRKALNKQYEVHVARYKGLGIEGYSR